MSARKRAWSSSGIGQLEARENIQAARQRVWEVYAEQLRDWAGEIGATLPQIPAWCEQSYHMFYLLMPSCDARQDLIEHLKRRGILSVFHYVPLHSSPMGVRLGGKLGQCPVTERVSDTLLRLPFHGSLSESAQAEVIEAIREFKVRPRTQVITMPSIVPDLVPMGLANLAQACADPAEARTQHPSAS